MANLDLSKLKELPSESRTRVEEALKATLESQLANIAGGTVTAGGANMTHSRSKGFFFSRSKSSDALRDRPYEFDNTIIRNLNTMDDAAFSQFADRLSTLKNLSKKG